jgi:hypothetical protein
VKNSDANVTTLLRIHGALVTRSMMDEVIGKDKVEVLRAFLMYGLTPTTMNSALGMSQSLLQKDPEGFLEGS